MKDNANTFKAVVALVSAVYGAADVNGATVDRNGFDSLTFVVNVGAEGDTLAADLAIAINVEHSDDDSTWAAVTDANHVIRPTVGNTNVSAPASDGQVFLADAGAEAPTVFKVGYIGGKRYARLVYNKIGTHTNGTPCGAVAILGHPQTLPA